MSVAATSPADRRTASPTSGLLLALGLVLLSLTGVFQLVGAWNEGLSGGRDFVQDYAAVVKIVDGRNPYEPYNDVTQALFGGPPHKGALYSFHAPTSLPLLLWLAPFAKTGGYTGAFMAWGLFSLVCLWLVCWLTLRVLNVAWPLLFGLLLAFALIILPAVRECFEEGQLNVAVAAGMVGCWAARREGRSRLAGVLLALAFALKPIPGLFFIYYAWRRDMQLLLAAAVTLAVLSVFGVGLAGITGTVQWATVNYPSHADVWPGYPDNASVRGFFTRVFGPSEWRPRPPFPLPYAATLLWAAVGGLLMLAAVAVARGGFRVREARPWEGERSPVREQLSRLDPLPLAREDARGDLEIAALTVLTLLVTPIVWPHYYVVLIMPVAVVAVYLARLALDGSAWTRPAWLDLPHAPGASASPNAPTTPPGAYDARRRVLPTVAIIALGLATLLLGSAQYVEPFRGVGGQLLTALLIVFGASLVALGWCVRDQGRGVKPADAR
ncbi:MAG: DUF2029 domain-containing protein [Chloroflexi bacterium]|nr:DUF2029 domain-containing protein [Chloroflexota bacterium]